MTRREQIIIQLLERYTELTDPMQSGNGGNDTGLRLMPHDKSCLLNRKADSPNWTPARCTCSRRGINELERLLKQMREDRHTPLLTDQHGNKHSLRSCWWHITEKHIRSTTVLRDIPVKRKAKGNRKVTVLERQAVKITNPRVNDTIVNLGITWLADHWTLAHEPFLPDELRIAA